MAIEGQIFGIKNKDMSNVSEFQVFISHDTRDYALALRVFNILNRIHARPYLYELFPKYREDIHMRLHTIMKNCELCLCLLTYNGMESQWVHQELGAAYALERTIIPCIQLGVNYKGFVQFRPRIDYDPANFESFAYQVIWAIRDELLGHEPILFTLSCPKGHKADYSAPSTDQLNDALEQDQRSRRIAQRYCFIYNCSQCGIPIHVSPWTLEEVGG